MTEFNRLSGSRRYMGGWLTILGLESSRICSRSSKSAWEAGVFFVDFNKRSDTPDDHSESEKIPAGVAALEV
jgi:hypothetical protein